MKSLFIVLVGVLVIGESADAGLSRVDRSTEDCVKSMMSNPDYSKEKAHYACSNPYADVRQGDTEEQEKWRQEIAQDLADSQEENQRADHAAREPVQDRTGAYIDNGSIDSGLWRAHE